MRLTTGLIILLSLCTPFHLPITLSYFLNFATILLLFILPSPFSLFVTSCFPIFALIRLPLRNLLLLRILTTPHTHTPRGHSTHQYTSSTLKRVDQTISLTFTTIRTGEYSCMVLIESRIRCTKLWH